MATIEFHDNTDEVINLKNGAVERALEAIGIQAEAYAKMICPVDTGRLRSSITHAQEDEDTEILGSAVEYAPYVEYGTRRTKAQPFFQPAIQDHTSEYKRIAETYLKDA